MKYLMCNKITLTPGRYPGIIIVCHSPSNVMRSALVKDHLINMMLVVIGNLVEESHLKCPLCRPRKMLIIGPILNAYTHREVCPFTISKPIGMDLHLYLVAIVMGPEWLTVPYLLAAPLVLIIHHSNDHRAIYASTGCL